MLYTNQTQMRLYDLGWPEKGDLMASFSAKQLEEIDKYLESINWYYDSEASLIALLHEMGTQLVTVGLPTIDSIKHYEVKDLESFSLSREMKRKSNQLYLMQLDPVSRFPNE